MPFQVNHQNVTLRVDIKTYTYHTVNDMLAGSLAESGDQYIHGHHCELSGGVGAL